MHEDRFPVPGTSAHYGFRKETISETPAMGESADPGRSGNPDRAA
jgi:hypothetical protein